MTENSFPQRSASHITDSRAKTLLRQALPPQWILREQSENDYGIDFHLEFTDDNHQVIGQIAGIQLKGTASGDPRNPEALPTVAIRRTTLNLWMMYETPVFIVMIDVDTQRIYFKSIEFEKRRAPARYIFGKTESISLRFTEEDRMDLAQMHSHYHFAKNLRMLDWVLPSIISTHKNLISLFSRYQRDGHMSVDGHGTYDPEHFNRHEFEQRIRSLYSEMRDLCPIIGLPWKIPSIDSTIIENDGYDPGSTEMLEYHFTIILKQLDEKFQEIFQNIKTFVEVFREYWRSRNPELAAYAIRRHPMLSALTFDQRTEYYKNF
ncbi:DUF4365 domain-containing protein [Pseudomonas soli]|uniref:DUF4365 domain-containing protein n=1 Tax=Pseudomonas soli TaxID=1306993 RepID=UPI0028949DB4|nr:DUF4365 domain-containing protein [Pseudomonas soli]MDT3716693.1 DUF4365 domain-containing protein [Pseudomonas soli]MDT3733556.1 DUF4365 domain-containing protein [Pseudomonas soli]